jgi:preprotein translocase subunit SecF
MIYLAVRFEWKFAVAAIVANLHDVIIILGFFAFFQWEFSLPVLAAVLAVLGYSVNESVVIFDRIRENFRRYRKMTTVEIINNAITSTISRTIITHGSTQIMVLSMLLFGGPTLYYFALALTIGICFRYLFIGVRGGRHRDVVGHQARGSGQGDAAEECRPQRSKRRGHCLKLS